MARSSLFAVLVSVLCTSTALPANDQTAMLQGKLQLMGLTADTLKHVPAGMNLEARDFAGRVRSSLVVLFKLYATEERAQALAGHWAAVLQRGQAALGLPREAEELAWQLLEDAARTAEGAGPQNLTAWIPNLAGLEEALAATLERPGELAHLAENGLAWATKEITDMLEVAAPGQPMAAAARMPLLIARDYAAKIRSEELTHAIGTIDVALLHGDFNSPTTCALTLEMILKVLSERTELPMLGRLADIFEYLATAMMHGGDEPAAWPEAAKKVAHYAAKGNLPPMPSSMLKLLGQLWATRTTEETVGVLVQAGAGLLAEHGEQLGLGQGLVAKVGKFAELVQNNTASLSSSEGITQVLKQAVPQLTGALAEPDAVIKSSLLAGLRDAVPDWGIEFAAKLVPRLWHLLEKVMGPGQNSPIEFGELFSGLVPHIPGHPALQTLLEKAVSSLDGMLSGGGNASSQLLHAAASELREEPGSVTA